MLGTLSAGHARLTFDLQQLINLVACPSQRSGSSGRHSPLPLRPVLLHAGYMKGDAKTQKFQDMGLWAADEWHPSMAPAVLKGRLRTGGSRRSLLKVPVIVIGLAGLGAWGWRQGSTIMQNVNALQGQRRWRRPERV